MESWTEKDRDKEETKEDRWCKIGKPDEQSQK